MNLAEFLAQLDAVPWFKKIGVPAPPGTPVQQIFSWDEWEGPEARSYDMLAEKAQALIDELTSAAGDRSAQAAELEERIHRVVFRDAAPKVPHDPNEDCYHPPTQAVWHAACTAGLMGLCLLQQHPVPPELEEQWRWFREGHWPCGWSGNFPDGRMIIY